MDVRALADRIEACRRVGLHKEADRLTAKLEGACAKRIAEPSEADMQQLMEGLAETMPLHPDPVVDLGIAGIGEIADRLEVHPRTIKGWRARRVMPAPDTRVAGNPVWRWERIAKWWEGYRHRHGRRATAA